MTTPSPRLDHTFFDNETRPHLGAVLLRCKLLRPEQLDEALERQRGSGKRLGQVLIDTGMLYEQDIARALALQHDLEYIDLQASSVDPRAASRLSPDTGRELCAIPVRFETEGLLVAVGDPGDVYGPRLVTETGSRVKLCVGEPTVIQTAWYRLLRGQRP
ncbi:MAG TPA: hypothetical protein VI408_12220 [Gaiellaceae bacterium]